MSFAVIPKDSEFSQGSYLLHRQIITYSTTLGLFLEVTTGGMRTWIFRYQFNGRQEMFTIGRYPGIPLKAAWEKRDSLAVLG